MDEDNNMQRRDEMLARFRESVRKPLTERYYDEDELLEIFDYAGDVNDDYLRVEALLCAARWYPDSVEFMERKAVFYSQSSENIRDRFLDDNDGAKGMIWDLLRIERLAESDHDRALKLLDEVVDEYDDYTDEEIIQLIGVAARLNAMDWVRKRLPELRKKAGFLNILLYEIAVNADMIGNTAFAVEMLEELTEIEPYNPGFWMMLAREYAGMEDMNKSIQAVEYALAIEPENTEALFVRARLLFVADNKSEEAMRIMEDVVNSDRESIEYVKFLAAIYDEHEMRHKALDVLQDFYLRHKSEAYHLIPEILLHNPKDVDKLLDDFYEYNIDNAQILWLSWAHQLMLNGMTDLSQRIIKAYSRNSGEEVLSLIEIESLFKEQEFESALNKVNEYLHNNSKAEGDVATLVIIHLVTLLRMLQLSNAELFCNYIMQAINIKEISSIAHRIEYIGMMKIIQYVKRHLKKGEDDAFWLTFDPLKLWADK